MSGPRYKVLSANDLPPLTVLVVSEVTGRPGDGYIAGLGGLNIDRVQVFDFDWYHIFPPTLEELEQVASL